MVYGLPIGNLIYFGNHFDKLLRITHITKDTIHWHHVIKRGASKFIVLLDKRVLFINTVNIEIILQRYLINCMYKVTEIK